MSKYQNIALSQLADCFRALSNPHRLQLFIRLTGCCTPGTVCEMTEEEKNPCVGDLGHELGIAPSTLSHHLKELNRAGLVRMERRGQRVECSVSVEMLGALQQFFVRPNGDE